MLGVGCGCCVVVVEGVVVLFGALACCGVFVILGSVLLFCVLVLVSGLLLFSLSPSKRTWFGGV